MPKKYPIEFSCIVENEKEEIKLANFLKRNDIVYDKKQLQKENLSPSEKKMGEEFVRVFKKE